VEAAVLFDFGGTLDADGLTWKERFLRLYLAEGVMIAPERFDRLFYAVDDELVGAVPRALSFRDTVFRLVAGIAEAMGLRQSDELVDRIARRFVEEAMETLRGNMPLLSRLSCRYRLGIVSNFYGNLATVCEEAGIRGLFGVIMDSGRVGYLKPDTRIFHRAVEELGLTPGDATFVGDSLSRDMAGAQAAGMRHIWLAGRTDRTAEPCCRGDRVIASLQELEGLL
jgi:putative hydrolase of the HAD superfamily